MMRLSVVFLSAWQLFGQLAPLLVLGRCKLACFNPKCACQQLLICLQEESTASCQMPTLGNSDKNHARIEFGACLLGEIRLGCKGSKAHCGALRVAYIAQAGCPCALQDIVNGGRQIIGCHLIPREGPELQI